MKHAFALFIAIAMLGGAVFGRAQMPQPIPKEMDVFKGWIGTWKGSMKMTMGGPAMSMDSVAVFKMGVGGRYLLGEHDFESPEMGKSAGLQMLTYDPAKKAYVGHWFDSTEPGVMEMAGNFEGRKLVMVGKPTAMPGMDAMVRFRGSWSMISSAKLEFKLEMESSGKWATVIEGSYTKV
jgi:hypothetical protein